MRDDDSDDEDMPRKKALPCDGMQERPSRQRPLRRDEDDAEDSSPPRRRRRGEEDLDEEAPRPRKKQRLDDDEESDARSLRWKNETLLRVGAWLAHGTAALALLLLALETQAMAIFCIVAGALIACAAVPTVPDRPITLYAAFGELMGYVFWVAVSAINQRDWLTLVPALLLATGAVWLLKQPRWPAAIFSVVAVLLQVALAVRNYRLSYQAAGYDQEWYRRSAVTSLVMLGVGLLYVVVGFAQSLWSSPRKKRRRRRAAKPLE